MKSRRDWPFIITWTTAGLFALFALSRLRAVILIPDAWWDDAHLYFRATAAWVSGADPWAVEYGGRLHFAGWPPTLLLNLPLLPFGEGSVIVWPILDTLGWALVIRRLRLPWVMAIWPPFIAALPAGNPDPALVGLIVAGGGAIAALAKPYALPTMVYWRRWRAVAAAVLLGALTLPLLPWGTFLADLPRIREDVGPMSSQLSAFGVWPVWLAAAAAIAVARRWDLVTPALAPIGQLHYALFSPQRSPYWILVVGLPVPLLAPIGVVAYAMVGSLRPWTQRNHSVSREAASAGLGRAP